MDFSTAILAGGLSSRMGKDKGLMPFRGSTMIKHILSQLKDLGNETFVVTNNLKAYNHIDACLVTDLINGIGPLGGIYTALNYAKYDFVLVLACDMPFINRPFLKNIVELVSGYDAVVPRINSKQCEPFRSVYAKSCTEPIKSAIDAGEGRVTGFLDRVRVHYVEKEEVMKFDNSLRSFLNVNSPAELKEAETI